MPPAREPVWHLSAAPIKRLRRVTAYARYWGRPTDIAPADWSGARAFLVAAPAGNDLSTYDDAEVEVTGIVQPPSLEAKSRERAEAERPHGNPNASGAAAGTDAPKGDMGGPVPHHPGGARPTNL